MGRYHMVYILVFVVLLLGLFFGLKSYRDQDYVDSWEVYRNRVQPPDKVMDAMGLKPGMVIGEIGAGRGRYAVQLALRVGDKGKVYANDISKSALEYLKRRCKRHNIHNIVTIPGDVTHPRLPEKALDFAFMISTYHHLDDPVALMKNIVPALKPGGKLVIVERDPVRSGVPPQSCTPKKVLIRQAADAGFRMVRVETFLEEDNIYIFRAKGDI